MDQIHIDIIPPKGFQRTLKTRLVSLECQSGIGPDFGNDEDIVFSGVQGLAEAVFGFPVAITLGGIKCHDAAL